MKPEYIGVGNFDTDNYVYAYCKCPLPVDYAIKWPLIKDGKPHRYNCICEDCGTEVGVFAKSYGPEILKRSEAEKWIQTLKEISDECNERSSCIGCEFDDDIYGGCKLNNFPNSWEL